MKFTKKESIVYELSADDIFRLFVTEPTDSSIKEISLYAQSSDSEKRHQVSSVTLVIEVEVETEVTPQQKQAPAQLTSDQQAMQAAAVAEAAREKFRNMSKEERRAQLQAMGIIDEHGQLHERYR